jgi:hypothetical protein
MRRKPSLCQNLAAEVKCTCAQPHAKVSLKQIPASTGTNANNGRALRQTSAVCLCLFFILVNHVSNDVLSGMNQQTQK